MSKIQTINAESFRDTVFLQLSVNGPGNRRQVKNMAALEEYLNLMHATNGTPDGTQEDPGNAAVDLPKNFKPASNNSAVKVTKRLLLPLKATKENPNPDPFENARRFLSETKQQLCGRFAKAMPSGITEGLFVLRKEYAEEYNDALHAALETLKTEYIPAVLADYPLAKARAKDTPVKQGGLGPLYNEQDYCSPEEFAYCFGLEWQWLALGVPEDLPGKLRAEAAEKLEKQFTEAAEEVKNALRESFAELISHAADKLKPAAPGEKAPQFKDSLIGNVQAFVDSFQARNLMNDTELSTLVQQAKNVLVGVQPDRLRKYANVREATRAEFAALQTQLDAMIAPAQSRKFDLDPD